MLARLLTFIYQPDSPASCPGTRGLVSTRQAALRPSQHFVKVVLEPRVIVKKRGSERLNNLFPRSLPQDTGEPRVSRQPWCAGP